MVAARLVTRCPQFNSRQHIIEIFSDCNLEKEKEAENGHIKNTETAHPKPKLPKISFANTKAPFYCCCCVKHSKLSSHS